MNIRDENGRSEVQEERILARMLATELAGEALGAATGDGPGTTSTLLSTGKDDHEDE